MPDADTVPRKIVRMREKMIARPAQTYWILEKRQLEAMTSARRHDIVDRLAVGGPMSIKALAEQIGAQPSSLYHHVEKLLRVGLVIEAGTQVVNRRREQLYATPAPRMRLARALVENKHPAVINEIVASLSRQMGRDFKSGAEQPTRQAEGEERNFGFGRLIGRPTPAQLARINACLTEIGEILWSSADESAQAVSLGWVIAPVDE